MKVGTFIKIISDYFASQIIAPKETKRVNNQMRYSFVLTWFTTPESDSVSDDVRGAINKSGDNCDKYLNPMSEKDMPINDAKLLKGQISSDYFYDIFERANLSEEDLHSLKTTLKKEGITIKGSNYVEEITSAFRKVIEERALKNKKSSIRGAEFIGDNKVKIGTKVINLPTPLSVPNLPKRNENKYITALLEVYSVDSKKNIKSIDDLESLPIYKADLQMHREAFYDAESVLHQIRDFFSDGESEFNNVKQEIYESIKRPMLVDSPTPLKKVNDIMQLVITVNLSRGYLTKQGNGLIGSSQKQGMVHMLINDGRVKWIISYKKEDNFNE